MPQIRGFGGSGSRASTAHYDVSMAIGERALLPAVRGERPGALVIADGFSCREQIRHGTGRTALHTAEAIALALRELARVAPEDRPSRPRPAPALSAGQS